MDNTQDAATQLQQAYGLDDTLQSTPSNDPYSGLRQAFGGDTSPQDGEGKGWTGFVKKALKVAKEEHFPASVILGQAALESAHGSAAPGNNYFGIKGQGTAGANNLATQEYGNGGYYGENSDFAAYQDPEDSIRAYVNLIKRTPRYKDAYEAYKKTGQAHDLINGIWQSGYATSPTYVQSVENTPEFQYYAKGGN